MIVRYSKVRSDDEDEDDRAACRGPPCPRSNAFVCVQVCVRSPYLRYLYFSLELAECHFPIFYSEKNIVDDEGGFMKVPTGISMRTQSFDIVLDMTARWTSDGLCLYSRRIPKMLKSSLVQHVRIICTFEQITVSLKLRINGSIAR
jgi:hypothetical protein